MQIYDRFSDVELFQMFSVDCGTFCRVRVLGGFLQVWQPGGGDDLWYCRPRKQSRVNVSAQSPEELKRLQNAERADRAEMMRRVMEILGEVENPESYLPTPTYL